MPSLYTVANLAIFVGINGGYKHLRLYGVDHTYFDSLCVNEDNQVCTKIAHFYNDKEEELRPLRRSLDGKVYTMSEYLKMVMEVFRSHDILYKYSKYMKVQILNCTKGSMIDSYERK